MILSEICVDLFHQILVARPAVQKNEDRHIIRSRNF